MSGEPFLKDFIDGTTNTPEKPDGFLDFFIKLVKKVNCYFDEKKGKALYKTRLTYSEFLNLILAQETRNVVVNDVSPANACINTLLFPCDYT